MDAHRRSTHGRYTLKGGCKRERGVGNLLNVRRLAMCSYFRVLCLLVRSEKTCIFGNFWGKNLKVFLKKIVCV